MELHKYLMSVAQTVSIKSKDSSTKVGCVIVDEDNRIVSTGYNGFVAGCNEDMMTQERPMKYHLVIHAELNAIMFARKNLKGHTLYTTHAPCASCLKHALQAGIRNIYYYDSSIMKRTSYEENEAVSRLIASTGATVRNIKDNWDYEDEIYNHVNNLETDKW